MEVLRSIKNLITLGQIKDAFELAVSQADALGLSVEVLQKFQQELKNMGRQERMELLTFDDASCLHNNIISDFLTYLSHKEKPLVPYNHRRDGVLEAFYLWLRKYFEWKGLDNATQCIRRRSATNIAIFMETFMKWLSDEIISRQMIIPALPKDFDRELMYYDYQAEIKALFLIQPIIANALSADRCSFLKCLFCKKLETHQEMYAIKEQIPLLYQYESTVEAVLALRHKYPSIFKSKELKSLADEWNCSEKDRRRGIISRTEEYINTIKITLLAHRCIDKRLVAM